jgi:PAS domain-containing protein
LGIFVLFQGALPRSWEARRGVLAYSQDPLFQFSRRGLLSKTLHMPREQVHKYNFKALEQIYHKEESFVEILNRIPDGLFTTDGEYRITFFNPAAEKITGFSAYDAVGMYCKDVFKNPICETDCALKRAVADGGDIHNRDYPSYAPPPLFETVRAELREALKFLRISQN